MYSVKKKTVFCVKAVAGVGDYTYSTLEKDLTISS